MNAFCNLQCFYSMSIDQILGQPIAFSLIVYSIDPSFSIFCYYIEKSCFRYHEDIEYIDTTKTFHNRSYQNRLVVYRLLTKYWVKRLVWHIVLFEKVDTYNCSPKNRYQILNTSSLFYVDIKRHFHATERKKFARLLLYSFDISRMLTRAMENLVSYFGQNSNSKLILVKTLVYMQKLGWIGDR